NLTLLDAISVTGSEVSMAKLPRRKCKVCREWFSHAYSNVVWCCPEHGAIYALELRARRIRDKYQTDKAERQANAAV
ncbi:recombination protein NinG, partial [Salmonella enterica]|uniref:recombination protein NinG n=1 Tax=Salmonella enterica TaxID=28901 RepID=UPI00217E98AD